MVNFAYAYASQAAALGSNPVENPWPGMTITWTGWDGSVWPLNSRTTGVALLPGVRGFGSPPVTRYTQTSPAVAGSRHQGSIVTERPVFWPILVWSTAGTDSWLGLDGPFFDSLDTEHPGTWAVTQLNGDTRRLILRFVDDGATAFDTDPSKYGAQVYGLNLVANQPYWQGDTISNRFYTIPPAAFFSGPTVTISSGRSTATASITNPGEVDAHPVWTIIGPSTNATVGVGSETINVPITLLAGQAAQVDTNPTARTCMVGDWDDNTHTLSGATDQTDQLGNTAFGTIPPGINRALSVDITGNGMVDVDIVPLYKRAWGKSRD